MLLEHKFTMILYFISTDEPGDLSKEIDSRVKAAVVEFCGKTDGECKCVGALKISNGLLLLMCSSF